jgi:hypothetical protein
LNAGLSCRVAELFGGIDVNSRDGTFPELPWRPMCQSGTVDHGVRAMQDRRPIDRMEKIANRHMIGGHTSFDAAHAGAHGEPATANRRDYLTADEPVRSGDDNGHGADSNR